MNIPSFSLPFSLSTLTGTLAIIAFILLVWFFGPLIKIADYAPLASITARILFIFFVLLLIFLIWFIKRYDLKLIWSNMRQRLQNKRRDKQQQQEKNVLYNKKNLYQLLKNTLIKKDPDIAAYIKEAACYFIIGTPSDGRAELLRQLGFKPLYKNRIGLEQLTQLDTDILWFSDNKLIVNLNLVDSQEDSDENRQTNRDKLQRNLVGTFLKLLKRYRRKKCLDGILITMSMLELNPIEKNKTTNIAKKLAKKLQLIHDQINIFVPCYLITTKTDHLNGFYETFYTLSPEVREQPWGITITNNKNDSEALIHNLANEYDELIARLNQHVFAQLANEPNQQRREACSTFPQQMQLFKETLIEFIHELATHSMNQDKEIIRLQGFYFTSADQSLEPVDFLIGSIADKFDLAKPIPNPAPAQPLDFFIRKLFSHAIDNVTDSPRYTERGHQQQLRSYRISYGIAAAILIVGFIGFYSAYNNNKTGVQSLDKTLNHYYQTESKLDPDNLNILDTLPTLNSLYAVSRAYKSSTWPFYFGLYEPHHVYKSSENAFKRGLQTLFLPRVVAMIESQLYNEQDPKQLYALLKAYTVFADLPNTQPAWVKPPMQNYFLKTETDPTKRTELNRYLKLALQEEPISYPIKQALLHNTQVRLKKYLPDFFAYGMLEENAKAAKLEAINLSNQLGVQFNKVFSYDGKGPVIPGLYSENGFKNYFLKNYQTISEDTAKTNWVIGINTKQNSQEIIKPLTQSIQKQYARHYTKQWDNLLAHLHVVKFKNLDETIDAYNILLSPESPLQGILGITKTNTQSIKTANINVSQSFQPLNNLLDKKNSSKSQVDNILKNIVSVRNFLDQIKNDPNTQQAEYKIIHSYLTGTNRADPIRQLSIIANQQPEPVKHWLNELANHTLDAMMNGVRKTINQAWQTDVLPTYQANIKDRYPLNANGKIPLSITNFSRFLGHNGVLDKFFKTYLKPFMVTDKRTWEWRTVGSSTLMTNNHLLKLFERVNAIQETYFANNTNTPSLLFTLKPLMLSNEAKSVVLQLGNQSLVYRHGPQSPTNWRWPTPITEQHASIIFTDFSGESYSQMIEGPWAWFKLLNRVHMKSTSVSGRYNVSFHDKRYTATFELIAPTNKPVFNLSLLNRLQFPTTLF